MVVYYKGKQISGFKDNDWVGDPVLNRAKIEDENTSSSLNIAIALTQKEYDTLPEKNQHCFYLITDAVDFEFDHLENPPMIDGVKINENTTKADLDLITEAEVKSAIAGVFQYKGEVQSISDLPALPTRGNVYYVRDEDSSFAFNGETWNNLGASMDLSQYQAKEDFDLTTDTQTVVGGINEILNRAQPFEAATEDDPGTEGTVLQPDSSGVYLQSDNTWINTVIPTSVFANAVPSINGSTTYTSSNRFYAVPTSKPTAYSAWASAGNGQSFWREIKQNTVFTTTDKLMLEKDVAAVMPQINDTQTYDSDSSFYAPTSAGTETQLWASTGRATSPVATWREALDVVPVMTPATATDDGVAGLFPAAPAGFQNRIFTSYGNYKTANDSTSASAFSTSSEPCTVRDIYYALPTLNTSHDYNSSTNYYGMPTTNGTAGQICMTNGSTTDSWTWTDFTSLAAMGSCSSSAAGTKGLVPAPAKGQQGLFLTNKATWATPTLSNVSTSAAGFVPSASKGYNYAVLGTNGSWYAWPCFSTFSSSLKGLVPAPSKGYQSSYYLTGAGWSSSTIECSDNYQTVTLTPYSSLSLNASSFLNFGNNCGYLQLIFQVTTKITCSDYGTFTMFTNFKINGTTRSIYGSLHALLGTEDGDYQNDSMLVRIISGTGTARTCYNTITWNASTTRFVTVAGFVRYY